MEKAEGAEGVLMYVYQCTGCTTGPCTLISIDPEFEPSDTCSDKKHPDKRNPKLPWTDEEKQPILDADNIECAIADYQKLFPESTRTIEAIMREWYERRPEKRVEIPRGRKKGSTNKAPLPGTAREKYQIPFSTKPDAKAYNHAVYICMKYGKPYAEAVKLEEADLKAKKQKTAKNVAEHTADTSPQQKKTRAPAKKKEKLPYKLKNQKNPDKVATESPQSEPASSQLNCDKIVTGIHVRQVRPYKGEEYFGTLLVTSRNGDEVEIQSGGKKKHIVDVHCLEIVTGPGKGKKPIITGPGPEGISDDLTQLPGDESQETFEIQGLDEDLQQAMPEERPPTGHKEIRAARKISAGLVVDQRVRHNGNRDSPNFGKDGVILDIDDKGQILVDFGSGSKWLDPHVVIAYPYRPAEAEAAP